MADRPLLAMPRPARRAPRRGRLPIENISSAGPGRQNGRLGPKFEQMERTLSDPDVLGKLRDDPSAIVPERALVFEVASDVVDFYRAVRGVSSLEFLGEDEGDALPDEDFYVLDTNGHPRKDKRVPRRFYFTIPNQSALRELVSLWQRFQRNEVLDKGHKAWSKVFGHLADVRPWGPKDRLTNEAIKNWEVQLQDEPNIPIRLLAEFWYRDDAARRKTAEAAFTEKLHAIGAKLLDRSMIKAIKYHAVLAQVPPVHIRDLLDHPDVGLVTLNGVMVLRPQSMVSGPVKGEPEDTLETGAYEGGTDVDTPIAALLDGVAMARHDCLNNRLIVDDPDNFADKYGIAAKQRHGTAMASLILHGDLNNSAPEPPIRRRLYVRPVMHPQPYGFNGVLEVMPPDRLCIDLIWRAFIHMFDGEGSEEPTAPTVRVVNLSLGDANRRFAGVMSPWARLIDHLACLYNVLILVSAGNILELLPLNDVEYWDDFENADAPDRQSTLLLAILRHRAYRQLLSPSEAINALTVGAAHTDHISSNGQGLMAVDPYASPALPNPSSALGLGFKRTIKPEILFPGGAEQVRAKSTLAPIEISPVAQTANLFGIGVANPGPAGQTNYKLNMSGTSVATALATHNALRILEALEDLPDDPVYPKIDNAYYAVILKALLVHSTRWNAEAVKAIKVVVNEQNKLYWEHERDEISRFLGFGCPDIKRVVDCAENRATLLGWNTISSKMTDRYALPLPTELENSSCFRELSVTIAWLTPITHSHRMYRLAKLEASPGGNESFSIGVNSVKDQPSYHTLGKGTVYHQRWNGKRAAELTDDGNLILDVTCSTPSGKLDDDIKYAVVLTLEAEPDLFSIPVYESIRAKLRARVAVKS